MDSNIEWNAPSEGAETDEDLDIHEEFRISAESMKARFAKPESQAVIPAKMMVAAAVPNPLRKFSLLGMADELEASAADTTPLLGDFIMQGQATMIYAEPNTGKTLTMLALCLEAIEEDRINAANLYYVNADDSSRGLADKARLLQDVGAHILAPGYNGFRTEELVRMMVQAIETDTARGTCIIIDTLKKFTDLMDKRQSSAFAEVSRRYVMRGGTVIALGHTAKNANADGSPRYQGVTDIRDDFDSVYVAQPLVSKANPDQMVAKFTRIKSRADSPQMIAYAFAAMAGLSYAEKLASVRWISPQNLDDYAPEDEGVGDRPVVQAITQLIEAGNIGGKMVLAKTAAKASGVSHRIAVKVLEKYTGDTAPMHLWTFETRAKGVQVFKLIEQPKGQD